MAKLTIEEIKTIVESITYKPDWNIHLKDDGERMYVQIEATTLDSLTLEPTTWKSGKTYLSPFMCRQEIVGAVFGAIEKAELHEIREFFRYKGASIYNPHLDPDVLAEVAKKKESFNVRDNPMDMLEEEATHRTELPNPVTSSFYFLYDGKDTLYHWNNELQQVSWHSGLEWTHCGLEWTHYGYSSVVKNLASGRWKVVTTKAT